ncbi:MAG: Cobalt/zinc/cadmium efflux transporter [Rhizobacter sp.]|nr:Cobalt/zinc/cadmium efflux transporter [Rhizobacter sp.]
MKRLYSGAIAIAVVAAFATWSAVRLPSASGATNASAPAAPVAQIRSELAKQRLLTESLVGIGEVAPGQGFAMSFTRSGQVTALATIAGNRVSKGTVLAALTPDPASLQAYEQANSTLALAQQELDRLRQLLDLQLATRSQVDVAQKAVTDARQALKAMEQQDGGRRTSTLTAPFDGVVVAVPASLGDRVQAGAPILQLARTDSLRVQIGIEPADSPRIRAGMTAFVSPVAAPDSDATAIPAKVSEVQDVVDPKTQWVNAVVVLPRAAAGQLVPGMKVRAHIAVSSRSAVSVPRNAVLTDERGSYLFQVIGDKAHRVAVTPSIEASGFVAIQGLEQLAYPVVVVGNYELQDGMAVKEMGP